MPRPEGTEATACSALCARWVRPSFIFAMRAPPSTGLVQLPVRRMPRSRRQLRVRNPDVLLLLPSLAHPHCHTRIVGTTAVDRSIISSRHPDLHHRLLAPSPWPCLTTRYTAHTNCARWRCRLCL